ncbi:hypothetical protein [Candidatus Odyssella thessalonicensis]|uniref:hypothetical protein n=1 Tax=Candidatus Odyssella thessalonicensis TaxID=84647 RepID=UPI0003187D08|nr:hypothetical protein [Candidatus Odyssella thessalonicensis]
MLRKISIYASLFGYYSIFIATSFSMETSGELPSISSSPHLQEQKLLAQSTEQTSNVSSLLPLFNPTLTALPKFLQLCVFPLDLLSPSQAVLSSDKGAELDNFLELVSAINIFGNQFDPSFLSILAHAETPSHKTLYTAHYARFYFIGLSSHLYKSLFPERYPLFPASLAPNSRINSFQCFEAFLMAATLEIEKLYDQLCAEFTRIGFNNGTFENHTYQAAVNNLKLTFTSRVKLALIPYDEERNNKPIEIFPTSSLFPLGETTSLEVKAETGISEPYMDEDKSVQSFLLSSLATNIWSSIRHQETAPPTPEISTVNSYSPPLQERDPAPFSAHSRNLSGPLLPPATIFKAELIARRTDTSSQFKRRSPSPDLQTPPPYQRPRLDTQTLNSAATLTKVGASGNQRMLSNALSSINPQSLALRSTTLASSVPKDLTKSPTPQSGEVSPETIFRNFRYSLLKSKIDQLKAHLKVKGLTNLTYREYRNYLCAQDSFKSLDEDQQEIIRQKVLKCFLYEAEGYIRAFKKIIEDCLEEAKTKVQISGFGNLTYQEYIQKISSPITIESLEESCKNKHLAIITSYFLLRMEKYIRQSMDSKPLPDYTAS